MSWLVLFACVPVVSALLYSCVRRNINPMYEQSEKLPLSELKQKGYDFIKNNEPDSALICYSVIQNKYSPKMGDEDKRIAATAFNNAGYIYFYFLNDYVQAYAMLLRALEVADEVGYDGCKSEAWLNIGNIYANYDDEPAAVKCYRKALTASLKAKKYSTLYVVLCNMLTRSMCVENHPDKTLEQVLPEIRVLDTVRTGDMPLRRTCLNLTEAYRLEDKGDYTGALARLDKAAEAVDAEYTSERFRINIMAQKAYLQSKHGRHDDAIATLRRSVEECRRTGAVDLEGISYLNMADYFHRMGMKDSADYYKLRGYETNDLLMNMRKLGTIKDMERSSQMRVANMEIHDLISDKRMQFYVILIVSGAGVVILALLIWVLVKHRRLKQSHEALYRQIQRNIEPVLPGGGEPMPGGQSEADVPEKYAGSSLADADKQTIMAAIEKVMEDTEQICKEDFSVDRLASVLDVKTKHISQVLTEAGTSFNALRNDYRIREACRRLADRQNYGNYTIEAISHDLAFKSRTHFSALFKKTTGLTPGEYIKLSRKNRK